MTSVMQQEALQLYTQTLTTMTEVLETLRDEPDTDETLTDLANRIERDREWVRFLMALGEVPTRPPGWLKGFPTALIREQRELLTGVRD